MTGCSDPLVYIVIPSWNRRDDLLECLGAVGDLAYPRFRVLVVDNASTDGSVEAIHASYPGVEVVTLDRNYGATGASNVGFRRALADDAEYVLRLDSDTIVDPAMVTHLVKAAREHNDIGILTPKVYFYDDPTLIWFAGATQNRWDLGATGTSRYDRDQPGNSQPRDIDYAWSTGMLITRAALDRLGGFDADFLVYYEEVDFCLRAREAGLRIRFVPQAKMWHKVGSEVKSPWIAKQWARSKMILYRKHSRGTRRWILIIYAFLYALVRAVIPAKGKGNRGPLRAALAGLLDGLSLSLNASSCPK